MRYQSLSFLDTYSTQHTSAGLLLQAQCLEYVNFYLIIIIILFGQYLFNVLAIPLYYIHCFGQKKTKWTCCSSDYLQSIALLYIIQALLIPNFDILKIFRSQQHINIDLILIYLKMKYGRAHNHPCFHAFQFDSNKN